MHGVLNGEIFWYAIGCFYAWSDGSVQDVGYFARLGALPGPLFRGAPSAATAFFTFSADPFTPIALPPNDAADTFAASIDLPGRFHLYFHAEGGADFAQPQSFARGIEIATFERDGEVVGASTVTSAANLFTARLVGATAFEFGGQRVEVETLFGRGVTQMGFAGAPFTPSAKGATSARSFVGSAVRIGSAIGAARPHRDQPLG
ncbi:Hypothetical protein A7982_03156 [Minicystis rosea]|nr:Hypothetical protein A7982_03156 [Minicystis rosea]